MVTSPLHTHLQLHLQKLSVANQHIGIFMDSKENGKSENIGETHVGTARGNSIQTVRRASDKIFSLKSISFYIDVETIRDCLNGL